MELAGEDRPEVWAVEGGQEMHDTVASESTSPDRADGVAESSGPAAELH